jgi:hypothetical protein
MVNSLERSRKNRMEFRRKDGSRPIFPEDWNKEVRVLDVDSMSDFVSIEVRSDGTKAVMGS